MSDLKIYNNGENKVLMSAGDRIIRQPYEFGNAFGTNGISFITQYLNIDINKGGDFTFFLLAARSAVSSGSQFAFRINFSDGSFINQQFRPDVANVFVGNTFLNTNLIFGSINIASSQTASAYALFCISYNAQTGVIRARSGINTFVSYSHVDGLSVTNIVVPNTIVGNFVKYGRMTFFERVLMNQEINFFVNNMIIQEFQSRVGVVFDNFNNKAYILNNGGSDFVGTRNETGGLYNANFVGLPVGSLQDQLDFANANLFAPFIQ